MASKNHKVPARNAAVVIMDGLGGIPGKSALKKAKIPSMDNLAKKGRLGMWYALGKGVVPGSDTSHLLLFGYGLDCYPGRGPLEALGRGIKLKRGDVAFRVNFATVERGVVKDRRAGRISTEQARKIAKKVGKIKVGKFIFELYSTVEHRGVLVIRGGASPSVSDTDPHKVGMKALKCKPLSKEGEETAKAINEYVKKVNEALKGEKANTILLRGAGKIDKMPVPFGKMNNATATLIAGGAMYKGVARFVGMDVPDVKGATGDKNTSLKAKAEAALKSNSEIVFIHIKATDNFGHDGNLDGKARMIEKVDRELIKRIEGHFDVICITGDHATPAALARHSGHGAPFLAWGESIGKDACSRFEEVEASSKGSLGDIIGKDAIHLLVDWIGKSRKVGS